MAAWHGWHGLPVAAASSELKTHTHHKRPLILGRCYLTEGRRSKEGGADAVELRMVEAVVRLAAHFERRPLPVQFEDLRQRDIPVVDAWRAEDVAAQRREGAQSRSGEDGRVEPAVGRAVAEREERTTASGGTLARGAAHAGDIAPQLRIQRKSALESADTGQLPSAQNLARHTGAALQPGQLIRVA